VTGLLCILQQRILLPSAARLRRLCALERCRGDNLSGPAPETVLIDWSRWRVRTQRRRLHREAPSLFRRTRRRLFLAHGLLSRSSPCFLINPAPLISFRGARNRHVAQRRELINQVDEASADHRRPAGHPDRHHVGFAGVAADHPCGAGGFRSRNVVGLGVACVWV
jgi:hypothetical protein